MIIFVLWSSSEHQNVDVVDFNNYFNIRSLHNKPKIVALAYGPFSGGRENEHHWGQRENIDSSFYGFLQNLN